MVILIGCTESKTRILLAQLANCCQLLNLLALRDEGQNFGEGSSVEGTLQGGNNDNFAKAGSFLRKLDNVSEKLAFIDSNNIVGPPLVLQLSKGVDRGRLNLDATVRIDTEIKTVAEVSWKFDSQDFLASDSMFITATEQLGGFTGKHAAHDKFNTATLSWLWGKVVYLFGRLFWLHLGDLLYHVGWGHLAWFGLSDCGSLKFFFLI